MNSLKFLVVEGYAKEGREDLRQGGASLASELYARMLKRWAPGAEVEVVMLQAGDEGDIQLLRTTFRFGNISLKPVSELEDGEQPAISSDPPEDEGPELA